MSLTALPVTVSDLTQLQQGIEFFTNTAEATAQAASINAPGTTTASVFIYATQLLANNLSLSQVAMADTAIMEGGTIAVGNTTTPNTLTFLSTQFLPSQVANAIAHGFNPTVYAAEALGLALASTTGFNTNFAGLSTSAFVSAVGTATGVNANAITGFLANWTTFFTNNPNAHLGLTVQQAAYGSTFGDSIGVALLNPTSANLQTIVSTTPVNAFTPNTIQGLVANALIDNALGTYVTGVALGALPAHTPLQGEAGQGGVFLTQGIDTPTSGFSLSPNGTPLLNGFTATAANTVLSALPFVTPFGLGNNTLNTGDNLQTTGAAVGATTLTDVTSNNTFAANAPFATGVTINGVNQLNITGATNGAPNGFQGTVTGLKIENNQNSIGEVVLGGTGQGLGTLLTNINISGSGVNTATDLVNTVVLASGIGSATATLNIGLTGNLGKTGLNQAAVLSVTNDVGGGTVTAPNLTYGTWSITAANTANLQLDPDVTATNGVVTAGAGVGGATALVLAGAGNTALGTSFQGQWQLLKSIDESATTGKAIITGASAGNPTHFLASAANPLWLFGSNAGLLDNTGVAGAQFNLTNVKLGTGLDVLDISSATAAQVAALTTVAGTGSPTGDILIVQDSVATTTLAATFANIAGFTTLGIGGPTVAQGAAGTINMANLPASINNITYMTRANGAVTVNNGVSTLTVNVNHNSPNALPNNSTPLAINAAGTGLTDSLSVILGDGTGTVGGINGPNISFAPVGAGGSAIDGLSTKGYENVSIVSNGPAGQGNVLSGNSFGDVFTATAGAFEVLAISGNAQLFTNAIFVDGLGGTGVINDTLNAPLDIWAFGNNVNPSVASGPNFIATNAAAINAATSGGVFMGGSDIQFSGLVGDILTGSATKSNSLAGSNSNDTFTGGSGTDFITTDGGADIINLGAGHTGDHINLFFGNFAGNGGGFNGTVAGTFNAVAGLANSIAAANDLAVAGSWGVAPAVAANGTPVAGLLDPFALFLHTNAGNNGTSASQSVVNGFTGGDVIDISVGAWSRAGNGNGLNGGDLRFGFSNVAPGNDANIITVSAGQNVPAAATVIELNQVFASANAVALALGNNIIGGGGTYDLNFAGAPNGGGGLQTHFLALYTDPTGSAHIADVDVRGASTHSTADEVVASDMVQLTGVAATSLVNSNIHFVV